MSRKCSRRPVNAGAPHFAGALEAVDRGLSELSAEVSLLGPGTDPALAAGHPKRAGACLQNRA